MPPFSVDFRSEPVIGGHEDQGLCVPGPGLGSPESFVKEEQAAATGPLRRDGTRPLVVASRGGGNGVSRERSCVRPIYI